jgi:hypothetical protein
MFARLARCMARANPCAKRPVAVESRACGTTPPDRGVANLADSFHVYEYDSQRRERPEDDKHSLDTFCLTRDPNSDVEADRHGVERHDK